MDAVRKRTLKCRSWYLDVALIEHYWGPDRLYHHTAPITMTYALYEGLRLAHEEGLEARFRRHRENGAALSAGLGALGLEPAAQEGHRLPQLGGGNAPAGIDPPAERHPRHSRPRRRSRHRIHGHAQSRSPALGPRAPHA